MSLLKQFLRRIVSRLAHFVLIWHNIPSLIPTRIHKLPVVSDGPWSMFLEQGGTHVDNVEGLQSQLGIGPGRRSGGTHIDEINECVSHADVGCLVIIEYSRMAFDSLTCSRWQSQSSGT